jgi:membrane-associated phospholipid phosphatase
MKFLFQLILLLFGIAVSGFLTWVCIISGIDWQIAKFFKANSIFIYAAIPGVVAGMIVPFVIIGYYFLKGKKDRNKVYSAIALKLGLGFFTSFIISTILKSVTNRTDMEPFESLGNYDFSNGFRWGFLNSNSLWESFSEGWPSGHTFIATTFLVILLPILKKTQKLYHSLYVFVIMLSVVTSFHWFSDILSGAMLGIIIGKFFQINQNYESNH